MIKAGVQVALNASTYTAISTGTQDAFGFGVYAVDTTTGEMVPFYYAIDDAGTGEALAPNIGMSWGHYEKASTVVLYAKALSGTPSAVLIPARHGQ